MELHHLISSIAAFSFMSSAISMLTIRIVPPASLWRTLNRCRLLLMAVFMVVGLSTFKNMLFVEMMTHEGIIVSTLVSATIQSMLLYLTSVSFLQPTAVKRRFVIINGIGIVMSAVQLVMVFILFPEYLCYSAAVSVVIFLVFWVLYQIDFHRVYRQTIITSDLLTDEDTEVRFRWVKRFFIYVSILGITAIIAPFCSIVVYDVWMLAAALFYVYVVVSFVNYFASLSTIVSRMSLAPPVTTNDIVEQKCQQDDFTEQYAILEENLQHWIDSHGFVANDLVSDSLAQQLGVSIIVFRAYFKEKKNTDFRQWRLRLRVEYACQIIRNHPEYSYDAVADLVGICDRSNFNKAFKRVMGITPKEYSQRLLSSDNHLADSIAG